MGISCAESAYATLAPYDDEFTRHHRHDLWLGRLEALARGHACAVAASSTYLARSSATTEKGGTA